MSDTHDLSNVVLSPPTAKAKRRRRPRSSLTPPTNEMLAAIAEIRSNGTQAVCFFNNKGGVGKTTLVGNLAAELALASGLKVLVVDADPQCNLTQYCLTDDEFFDSYADEDKTQSIYSIIHPLSIGKGYQDKLPIRAIEKFGFDLIMGDPRLALKEDLLAQDWRDAKAGGTRGLRTTFIFHDLISKAEGYDFVIFDMGPSLGAINRSILLAVDHFVVPMSIDIFSLWGVRNIGQTLKVWQKELNVGIRLSEDPSELSVSESKRLNFLGYVTQQHKEKTEGESIRIVQAYEEIRKRLPDEIEKNLGSFIGDPGITTNIGEVKNLGSLAPKSQTNHVPMTMVTASGNFTKLRKRAREIYHSVASVFLTNVEKTVAKQ
jgi:cellulose biosynthesis protein BcsQ